MDARIKIIREMGGYRPSQALRLFEYERDGKRGWATERWLRSQGGIQMLRFVTSLILLMVGASIGIVIMGCVVAARRADLNAQQRFCRENCPYCPYYDPEAMG